MKNVKSRLDKNFQKIFDSGFFDVEYRIIDKMAVYTFYGVLWQTRPASSDVLFDELNNLLN